MRITEKAHWHESHKVVDTPRVVGDTLKQSNTHFFVASQSLRRNCGFTELTSIVSTATESHSTAYIDTSNQLEGDPENTGCQWYLSSMCKPDYRI